MISKDNWGSTACRRLGIAILTSIVACNLPSASRGQYERASVPTSQASVAPEEADVLERSLPSPERGMTVFTSKDADEAATRVGKKYFDHWRRFLVGVEEYDEKESNEHIGTLAYPEKDVKKLDDFFKNVVYSSSKDKPENITLLGANTHVYDECAKHDSINFGLQKDFAKSLSADSIAFVYLSGRGFAVRNEDDAQLYFAPRNLQLPRANNNNLYRFVFPLRRNIDKLLSSPARLVVVCLDLRPFVDSTGDALDLTPLAQLQNERLLVIANSQPSRMWYDAETSSPFADALLAALNPLEPRADGNRDGKITFEELQTYFTSHAEKLSASKQVSYRPPFILLPKGASGSDACFEFGYATLGKEFYARAAQLFREKNYSVAMIDMKRAASLMPQDAPFNELPALDDIPELADSASLNDALAKMKRRYDANNNFEDAETYLHNAKRSEEQKDYFRARDHIKDSQRKIEEALRAFPNEKEYLALKDSITSFYSQLQATIKKVDAQKQFQSAEERYRDAQSEYAAGRYESALDALDSAITMLDALTVDPEAPSYGGSLGDIRRLRGQCATLRDRIPVNIVAEKDYRAAVNAFDNKEIAVAREYLESALRALPNEERYATFRKRLDRYESDRRAAAELFGTAEEAFASGRFEEARRASREAAKLAPEIAKYKTLYNSATTAFREELYRASLVAYNELEKSELDEAFEDLIKKTRAAKKEFPKDARFKKLEDQGRAVLASRSWRRVMIAKVPVVFRKIPAGSFVMGSPRGEVNRDGNEEQRDVTIKRNFWMAETETTQELWLAVMGSNPSSFLQDFRSGGGELPVENVSWKDCKAFIAKLNNGKYVDDCRFALPTEEEWEYACRAGTTTAFSFGATLYGENANCNGEVGHGPTARGRNDRMTTKVRSYPANPWGLYDMHGNVWEWCETSLGDKRVNRGGSWFDAASVCRSAKRKTNGPDHKSNMLGFRLIMIER